MFESLVRPQVRDTLTTDTLLLQHDPSDDPALDDDHHLPVGSASRDVYITPGLRAAFEAKVPRGVLIPEKAHSATHLRHHGISYMVRTNHEGNSCILLQGGEPNSKTPFSIEQILWFGPVPGVLVPAGTWLVVTPHRRANVAVDPYLRYPHLRVGMWSQQLSPTSQVVPVSAIDTHFAKCVVPWEGVNVLVTISLSRVR